MTHQSQERPSTPRLISDAIRQATALLTAEVSLARLEVTEKVTIVVASIVSLVVAAVFIIVALIFLLQGLVEFLVAKGFAAFVASFIVGGGIAAIAVLAVLVAIRNMRPARLKPARTVRQLESTRDLVRKRTS